MPKERFDCNPGKIRVAWGPTTEEVQIAVNIDKYFTLHDDGRVYSDLWITVPPDALDELIKTLEKARRKTYR